MQLKANKQIKNFLNKQAHSVHLNNFQIYIKKDNQLIELYQWTSDGNSENISTEWLKINTLELFNKSTKEYNLFNGLEYTYILNPLKLVNTNILLLFCIKKIVKQISDKERIFILKLNNLLLRLIHENELRFENQISQTIFAAIPQAVFLSDFNGQILKVNKFACQLTGYKLKELKGLTISEITKSVASNVKSFDIAEVRQAEQLLFGTVLMTKRNKEIPIKAISQYIGHNEDDFFISFIQRIEEPEIRKQEIFQKIIETQNNERKRFSRDLHDGLGPLLSLAKLYISDLYSSDLSDNEKQIIVKDSIDLIDEAVKTTRSIANNLVPNVLKEFGIINAITEFISQIERNNRLHVNLINSGKNELDLNIQMEIYQIVRELLNNTLKHANATHVVLKFLFNKKHLNLKYSDNGKGMDFKKNKSESKGMGLSNITSRVVVLKGQINIQTKPNNGFTVVIEI